MCRILLVRGDRPFDPAPHLRALADIARNSREYQGHGWGCAWHAHGAWELYHDIRPIWEDPAHEATSRFPTTTVFLAHARSAFRDEGIEVENNMPFTDGEQVFAFNGELRGVRIKEEGRIGAEKIFNYLKRFHKGDLTQAVVRGTDVINRRTRYVRAMNIIVADGKRAVVSCHYSEDPDYFQLCCTHRGGLDIVCSEAYPGQRGWERIANGETRWLPMAASIGDGNADRR
jgi:glutamine amidotransferase